MDVLADELVGPLLGPVAGRFGCDERHGGCVGFECPRGCVLKDVVDAGGAGWVGVEEGERHELAEAL